uniref:MAGE domain-containing protein n=1 Tax=Macaca fascicularis TaxID=9541 RepID=A0A7N9IHK4_MACFA
MWPGQGWLEEVRTQAVPGIKVLRGQADEDQRPLEEHGRRRSVSKPLLEPPRLVQFLAQGSHTFPLSPGLWVSIAQLLPTFPPAALTRVSMPLEQRSQHYKPEEGLEARGEALGLVGAQAPATEEQETASSSSTVVEVTRGEVLAAESPGPPQSPQGASTLPTTNNYTLWSQSDEDSSSQEEEGPSTFPDLESGFQAALSRKVAELVHFLLLKYRAREPVTKAEMLESVMRNCQYFFPVIFSKASDSLQLVFGIELMEVDPVGHLYIFVTCLGLSYDGLLGDNQMMPKTGLLIIVLAIIIKRG